MRALRSLRDPVYRVPPKLRAREHLHIITGVMHVARGARD
jgi:hypothetical protein